MSRARDFADLAGSASAGSLTGHNLIINGAMQVWQRGTTIDTITNGGYLCDRWRLAHGGTDGNVDVDRSTDVPSGQGFAYSQKISMDASETSLDADDQVNLQQRFEGQNLQQILKGTSSAKSLTLSFWVKSSVASTYSVNLRDNDNTRVIASTYVINNANTWEKKTITFAGDTTGALDNDNARSLDLTFYMDAGTSFTGGTFASSWGDASNSNVRVFATTGWLESTSPEWYITGAQLEVGQTATPFEHANYGDTLAKCQRYYFKIIADNASDSFCTGHCDSTGNTSANGTVAFPVTMRDSPTAIETSGTAGDYQIRHKGSSRNCSSIPSYIRATKNTGYVQFAGVSSLVAGDACTLRTSNTSGYLAWGSEL